MRGREEVASVRTMSWISTGISWKRENVIGGEAVMAGGMRAQEEGMLMRVCFRDFRE